MASAAEVATPDKWQSMMRLIKANRQSYLTGTQLASSASGTNVRVPMLTPPMLAELVGALGVNEHWSALDIFKQKFHVLMDVNGEVTPVYTYLPNMTLAIGPWRIEIDAFADGMFGVQSAPTSGGAGVLESDGRDAASRKRGRDASAADTPTPAVTHAHKTRTATGAPAGQLSARSAGVEADADDDEEGEGDHPCTRKLEDGSACDKSYMSRRALWAHIRNKHEGLMFKCNYHGWCLRAFRHAACCWFVDAPCGTATPRSRALVKVTSVRSTQSPPVASPDCHLCAARILISPHASVVSHGYPSSSRWCRLWARVHYRWHARPSREIRARARAPGSRGQRSGIKGGEFTLEL